MQKTPFQLFVDGFATQEAAGVALGRSRTHVNLIYHGRRNMSLKLAQRVEQLSDGRYRAVDLLGLKAA